MFLFCYGFIKPSAPHNNLNEWNVIFLFLFILGKTLMSFHVVIVIIVVKDHV